MRNEIGKSDWKVFSSIRIIALERFCESALADVSKSIVKDSPSQHERYLRVYRQLKNRDMELARLFDNPRRSTTFDQATFLRGKGWITDEEFSLFSDEAQAEINLRLQLYFG